MSGWNISDLNETYSEHIVIENYTTDTRYYHGNAVSTILSVTMVFFMVLTFMGNALVILTVARHKGMKTRTNMFLVNLAVADMFTAVFNMPFSMITVIEGGWIFGDAFCQFNGFTLPLFFIVSIHTLMYISIHKYISITRPFSRAMSSRRIYMMVAASWLWATFCAVTTLKGGNHVLYKKGTSQCGPSIPDELMKYMHSIMITTCNYVIPLTVMSYCYWNIFREIHEHMNRIRETSNVDLQNSLNQQRRISGTLFLVLACFLFCWTPYILYTFTAAFLKDKVNVPLLANPVAYWCGYMNSACNPIIYALRSPSFRRGYKEILCRYKAPSIGGSLITRPSISPLGTMKRSVVSQEGCLLTSPQSKRKQGSIDEKSIQERRRRKSGGRLPKLSLSSLKGNTHYGPKLSDSSRSIKHNDRKFPLLQFMSLVDLRSIVDYKQTSSLSLKDDYVFIGEDDFRGRRQLSKSMSHLLTYRSSSAPATFSSNTFSSSDEDIAHNCPTVVVDVVSLKSPSSRSAIFFSEQKLSNGSLSPESQRNEDILDNANIHDATGIYKDNSKWSPASLKSLEIGRDRKNNALTRNRVIKLQDLLTRKRKKIPKPESPLYVASKEQLMQWLSQERLDRSVCRRKKPRRMVRRFSVDCPTRLSPGWLRGLRSRLKSTDLKKYSETSKDSANDRHL